MYEKRQEAFLKWYATVKEFYPTAHLAHLAFVAGWNARKNCEYQQLVTKEAVPYGGRSEV